MKGKSEAVASRIFMSLKGTRLRGKPPTRKTTRLAAPALPLYNPAPRSWGGSSAGRASRSQCEGRGFDPLPLHQFLLLPSLTVAGHKPRLKKGVATGDAHVGVENFWR